MASSSSALEKGAQNIVQNCLAARPGERLVIVHYLCATLVEAVRAAADEIGAECQVISANDLADAGKTAAAARLDAAFSPGGPTIWLAESGLANWVPHLTMERANRMKCRHIHLPRADARLFEQSIRAHPDELSVVNARVVAALSGAKTITVTGPGGTDLEILLDPRFPLIQLSGRPGPGEMHWLPAGQVYTHPAQINGTFVADRSLLISGGANDTAVGRAQHARFEIARGFVQAAASEDAADQSAIDAYLASAPHARRVATIIVPTNYLVRTEIGNRAQDGLLPGLNVNLGFADEATRAPYKTQVQMCLYARRLTVRADGRELVRDGRFTAEVVRGKEAFL